VVLVVVATSSREVKTITEQFCNVALTNTYRSVYISPALQKNNITDENAWSWQDAEAMLQRKLCPDTTSTTTQCDAIDNLRNNMKKQYGDHWECQCNDNFKKQCITNDFQGYCQHRVCRQSKTENEVWTIIVTVLTLVLVFAVVLWCWLLSE
jgi:hypothetical protein